jgi:hypothetical protein
MTFTLVSIHWDGMKYVLQKGPLGSLRFSPPSEALPARLLRSLALSTLPPLRSRPRSRPLLDRSLARPILLNVSPRGTL